VILSIGADHREGTTDMGDHSSPVEKDGNQPGRPIPPPLLPDKPPNPGTPQKDK
jgi:hypothetical protein